MDIPKDVGWEEYAPECCCGWGAILNSLRKRRKRWAENYRLVRILKRLRRKLKERQAKAAAESTETNQASDTTDVNQAQVTGEEPRLMWHKRVIMHRRWRAAAAESSISGSQKATETNQETDTTDVNKAQVTGQEPLMWSQWTIIHPRRKLEPQAEAAKATASESSLNKTQTDEVTEAIEIPQGVCT